MVTKGSEFYVPYLFMQIKYKSITVYIKNKKGGATYIIVLKWALYFEYISKESAKQRQVRQDETKEENHWNFTAVINYAFCFLICFLIR